MHGFYLACWGRAILPEKCRFARHLASSPWRQHGVVKLGIPTQPVPNMSQKHRAERTPEQRHLLAAEHEFAEGMVKYALWNAAIEGPETVSDEHKTRYIKLRAEQIAIDEAMQAAHSGNVEVVPYEVLLASIGGPKLLTELPAAKPEQFRRPYFLFTSKRLLIVGRETAATESALAPNMSYQDEIEQFWLRARASITPHNNTATVRAIDAVIQGGGAISIPYDDMRVRVEKQPLSLWQRLSFSDPEVCIEFAGVFSCGERTQDATVSIKPAEPFNEIERILRLLPIEVAI